MTTESRWGERLRLVATLAAAALLLTFVFMALQAEQAEPEQGIDRLGPLPGYPACERFVPDRLESAPTGLIAPRSAAITRVRRRGPLTRVNGYLPMTPVQLRRYYQERRGVTVMQIEDEIIEAEALISDGRYRSYVKATAVCELGSRFIGIVAAERSAETVPTPTGSPPASR